MVFDSDHNLRIERRSNQIQILSLVVQNPHLIKLIQSVLLLYYFSSFSFFTCGQEKFGIQVRYFVVVSCLEYVKTLIESIIQGPLNYFTSCFFGPRWNIHRQSRVSVFHVAASVYDRVFVAWLDLPVAFCVIWIYLFNTQVIMKEQVIMPILMTAESIDVGEVVWVYLLEIKKLVRPPLSESQPHLIFLGFVVQFFEEKLSPQS